MNKAILVMDMPSCCYECFAFDDNGDHPMCLVTKECKGYRFRAREEKMDKCPLKPAPKEDKVYYLHEWSVGYKKGWNDCVNYLVGE